MSASRCPRLFEIEAARDGRLTGRALASLDVHRRSCAQCRAESSLLDAMASALGALPVAETDALTMRRQRQRLLARFNDAQVSPPAHRRRTWAAVALVAACAVAFVLVVHSRRGDPSPTASRAATPVDPITIVAQGATWSRIDDGATTRVRLDDGELDVHVAHGDTPHAFVVELPDGQLEDVGTTFRVRVHGGQTVAVDVGEGIVVLRRTGRDPTTIVAGGSWSAESPSATGASAPASNVATAPPRATTPPKREPDDGASAREFRDAVTTLNAGDNVAAACELRAFLARHPAGAQAEDAAYLLVLALRRAGDDTGARDAARAYLRKYPHGFRRTEVETLARTSE
jgi:hypothetical protein